MNSRPQVGQTHSQTWHAIQMEDPMAYRPYLFFGGNCREALTRYKEGIRRRADTADDEGRTRRGAARRKADLIIHAALTFGDDLLMASDDPTADNFGPVQGMMVSYDAADVDDAKRVFEALRRRWNVTQALRADFFSSGSDVHRPVRHPWMVVGPQLQQPS